MTLKECRKQIIFMYMDVLSSLAISFCWFIQNSILSSFFQNFILSLSLFRFFIYVFVFTSCNHYKWFVKHYLVDFTITFKCFTHLCKIFLILSLLNTKYPSTFKPVWIERGGFYIWHFPTPVHVKWVLWKYIEVLCRKGSTLNWHRSIRIT